MDRPNRSKKVEENSSTEGSSGRSRRRLNPGGGKGEDGGEEWGRGGS